MKKILLKSVFIAMLAIFGLSNNANAQALSWAWDTATINGLGSMIVDGSGNIFMAHDLGTNSTFLAKYDNNANEIWSNLATGISVRDRKSTRLNSSHIQKSRMPSSA